MLDGRHGELQHYCLHMDVPPWWWVRSNRWFHSGAPFQEFIPSMLQILHKFYGVLNNGGSVTLPSHKTMAVNIKKYFHYSSTLPNYCWAKLLDHDIY
jgi:hypothetical protein